MHMWLSVLSWGGVWDIKAKHLDSCTLTFLHTLHWLWLSWIATLSRSHLRWSHNWSSLQNTVGQQPLLHQSEAASLYILGAGSGWGFLTGYPRRPAQPAKDCIPCVLLHLPHYIPGMLEMVRIASSESWNSLQFTYRFCTYWVKASDLIIYTGCSDQY